TTASPSCRSPSTATCWSPPAGAMTTGWSWLTRIRRSRRDATGSVPPSRRRRRATGRTTTRRRRRRSPPSSPAATSPVSPAARCHYTQRVTECALACAVLARRLGTAAARLGDLSAPETLLADLDRLLPEEATRAALPALTGLAADALGRRFFPAGTTLTDPARFRLRARARHVLGEAARVAAAEHALRAGDLGALGALMDASHRSCAEDFGVSTPALDRLVAVARAGGARGARLTGAGFGGAIVALAERADTERVTEALDRDF